MSEICYSKQNSLSKWINANVDRLLFHIYAFMDLFLISEVYLIYFYLFFFIKKSLLKTDDRVGWQSNVHNRTIC